MITFLAYGHFIINYNTFQILYKNQNFFKLILPMNIRQIILNEI